MVMTLCQHFPKYIRIILYMYGYHIMRRRDSAKLEKLFYNYQKKLIFLMNEIFLFFSHSQMVLVYIIG